MDASMATIDTKSIIDEIVAAGGHQYEDEPPVARIVEYRTPAGATAYGVTWRGEVGDPFRYDRPSQFVHDPKLFWEHPADCAKCQPATEQSRVRGPWVVVDRGHQIEIGPEPARNDALWAIAELTYTNGDAEEVARLIAAAPALLEALEAVTLDRTHEAGCDWFTTAHRQLRQPCNCGWETARAAIEAARGASATGDAS